MVLDFLPYKVPEKPRKKIGWIRYVTFALSLIFVGALFLSKVGNIERIMFWAFISAFDTLYADRIEIYKLGSIWKKEK